MDIVDTLSYHSVIEAATGQRIGLLSTVELYKLVVAVKDSFMSKAAAMQILKKPGRIELEINGK